jgi:alkanesulfonate monooxygenase SsuD/methylene tetrahydromethanopterin reductase-like flavin-dependent oxidoreductase (luciferase family)
VSALAGRIAGVAYYQTAPIGELVARLYTRHVHLDVVTYLAVLGIGAAWHDVEHEAMGFDFPPVRERMDRLEEAVQICRLMFTEETPSFDGRYYRVHEVRNVPRPLQPGGPKIMIGGGGEKRTLKLVAQYADLCNITGDAAGITHKLDVLRAHCDAVGRDYAEIGKTRLASLMLTDSAEQTQQVREVVAAAAGADAGLGFNIGEEQEIVDQVGAVIEAGIDTLIFNMPFGGPETVERVGTVLVETFS